MTTLAVALGALALLAGVVAVIVSIRTRTESRSGRYVSASDLRQAIQSGVLDAEISVAVGRALTRRNAPVPSLTPRDPLETAIVGALAARLLKPRHDAPPDWTAPR